MQRRSIGSIALVLSGAALCAGMRLSSVAKADPAEQTPAAVDADGVFSAHGLSKVGSLLIISSEAEVHTDANTVRGLKSKVVSETLARSALARSIETADKVVSSLNQRLINIKNQMNGLKDNPDKYNQLVEPHNSTLKELQARVAQVDEMRKKQGRITDSQAAFGDAAVEAAAVARTATAKYAALAKDAELTAAIDKYNQGSTKPVKLGPSGAFVTDAGYLQKCVADMTADGIPVRVLGGVPTVEVVVNEKRSIIIWDSGASFVSLSSETAADWGLHPTEKDRTIALTIADGSQVQAKVVIAPVIRVGPFMAENVECVIAPPSATRPPDLLGGSFQNHFLCRLDQRAGVLHLTPIDKSVSAAPPDADAPPRVVPVKRPTAPKAPAPAPSASGASYQLWTIHFADSALKVWLKADGTAVSQLGAHGTWQKKGDLITIAWKDNKHTLTAGADGKSAAGTDARGETLSATLEGTDHDGVEAPPK